MIKKTFEYLLFSGLSAFIGFVTVIYMTNHMSIDDFGIVGLYMAILYVLPQLVSFSSIGLVSINKVKLDKNEFQIFSSSYITFVMIIFFIVFFMGLFLGLLFKHYLLLGVLLPIIAFIQFLNMFHNAELIQDSKSKKYGMYRLLLSTLYMVFTIFFLYNEKFSWDGRLFAIVLSEIILLLVTLKLSFKTLKNFQIIFDKTRFKEYIFFGLPLMFGLIAGWLLNQSDRFIVLHFFSLKDVGLYTLAYNIGVIVNMINQAATNAVVPTIYKFLEEKRASKYIRKLNILYSIIILSIAILIGFSSYWFVPLLFGEKYQNATSIIFFIAIAFAFNGIYRTTGSVIAFYKQNILQTKLLFESAFVNIIISILFIPVFSILSPAIGTIVAYFFLALSSYIYGWKILKRKEYNEITN